MSEIDNMNDNKYVIKFVENSTRIIGLTGSILSSLKERYPNVAKEYEDIPALLELGKTMLINMNTPNMMEDFIIKFFDKAINHLELLRKKDDSILTERLNIIMPDNPYVKRIQYLYGANQGRIKYCTEKEIQNMWLLIHALVHNAIKHIVNKKIEPFYSRIISECAIDKWKVDFNK